MKTGTRKIVMAALFAALCCVATMAIRIPSPMKGYLNLGDCVVLLSGWLLSPVFGFLAAGIGSGLADLLAGYVTYAPATFLIKGIMALIAFYGAKLADKVMPETLSRIVCGAAAELAMILGYLVFEGFLYGFGPSLVNVPANGVQGIAGLILGVALVKALGKRKVI